MKKEKPNNGLIKSYISDYKTVTRDETGQEYYEIDIWSYCEFFAEHIQLKFPENQVDGIPLVEYARKVEQEQKEFLMNVSKYAKDGYVCDFQDEMKKSYGISVNAFALYNLCQFINEINKQKLVFLLKPTFSDTLSEVKELESITFTNKDGSTSVSRHTKLKEAVLLALEKGCTSEYEVERVDYRRNVCIKEMAQIEFLCYLSNFFNQYFNIKRRGWLTRAESKIIGYLLKYFGLSQDIVTSSRLRQLKKKFDYLVQDGWSGFYGENGNTAYVQCQFIKYKDWRFGKINPLKQEITPLEKGDKIIFPSD